MFFAGIYETKTSIPPTHQHHVTELLPLMTSGGFEYYRSWRTCTVYCFIEEESRPRIRYDIKSNNCSRTRYHRTQRMRTHYNYPSGVLRSRGTAALELVVKGYILTRPAFRHPTATESTAFTSSVAQLASAFDC
jgi:hypothetical protein